MTEQASMSSTPLAAADPLEQMETDHLRAYNQGLTPLHPPQKSLMRLNVIFGVLPLVIASFVAAYFLQTQLGIAATYLLVPFNVFAFLLIVMLPYRKFRRWGYEMGDEQLRVLRGFLWRTDTIVPFNRIQHIDVAQGPLQRWLGLSTLVVHTAGTHNSIVTLPGLATADAEAMRETIKGHIRKDMI
ncbi:PH domain-containing protein [Parasphingorhabdus halotolerans]|nr:PH domain-containing protein [Parasphingorhabdus halotolerans]